MSNDKNPGDHRSGKPADPPNELGKLGANHGNQPDVSKEVESGEGVPMMDDPQVNPKAPKGPPKA